jgi:hypothetical protein
VQALICAVWAFRKSYVHLPRVRAQIYLNNRAENANDVNDKLNNIINYPPNASSI